jgi:HTH-type transcriptional regulator/antitoxin HigA
MDIKPIRTEDDYAATLQMIDSLWGAPYGSLEGDKLDILITLVEAYEEKHYPIRTPDTTLRNY